MRISDWSSDVCSSDLTATTRSDTINPNTVTLSVAQPLYRGGRTESATDSAEALVLAGRQDLSSTERRVLLDAVTAYMDVVQNQAVLDLNRNNRSEEHTSELQSLMRISYAVFCLKKKK